jgi:hypothetical protein
MDLADPCLDLPLLSNIDDVRVNHYCIALTVAEDALNTTNVITGDVIVFLRRTDEKELIEDRLKGAKRRKKEQGRHSPILLYS